MKKILTTLCIPVLDNRVLLGLKKRGFGEGYWNGFGGKVEPGEKIIESAKRELFEEAKIKADFLHKVGEITFTHNFDDEVIEMIVFRIDQIIGRPQETEEMKPQWFNLEQIPFEKMWPDDFYWFPLFLERSLFKARFEFNQKQQLKSYQIKEVNTL